MKIQYEQHLLKRNIKPTSTQILVLKTILNGKGVFSLANLEDELETVDKSTIFRTLNLFQQHHLLQRIADGWRYGTERNDSKKLHPCLVPYDELPESEKEYDRKTAMETLKVINVLGYNIEKDLIIKLL